MRAALIGFFGLIMCCMITGCHKQPHKHCHFDNSVKYRIFVFTRTCKPQPDGTSICRARFDPQEVRAK